MRISDWSSDVCSSDLINEDDAPAPSVITLNALGASQAANDFLFYITGLVNDDAFGGTIQGRPLKRTLRFVDPRRDKECPDCGSGGRLARGDKARLRSEEHTSELQSLMRISYAVFCLKKKT